MSSKRQAAFVGLDLETTGLDAVDGEILEVGIVLFDADLKPITGRSWLVDEWDHVARYVPPQMSPDVSAMHSESGLLADLKLRMGEPMHQVENHAIHYLIGHDAVDLPMLGSSVTFDRTWLAEHAPGLLDTIHYRSLDATSVRMAALAHIGSDNRATAGEWITRRAGQLRDEMLTDLEVSESLKRKHRPLYDLCSSAALVLASGDAVAGRAITKTLEDLYPEGEGL